MNESQTDRERSGVAMTLWLLATVALFLFALPPAVAALTRRGVPLAVAYALAVFVMAALATGSAVLISPRRSADARRRQVRIGVVITIAMTLLLGCQITFAAALQAWQLPGEIVEYGSWLGAIVVAGGTAQAVAKKLSVALAPRG